MFYPLFANNKAKRGIFYGKNQNENLVIKRSARLPRKGTTHANIFEGGRKMKISQNNYLEHVSSKTPRTNEWKTLIWAFLVGGGICTIGQIIREIVEYEFWQLTDDELSAIVSGVMIFLGATFTGVGLYDRLGTFAGAGSMVPITGFANSIVSPALEYKSEGMIYGLAAKMFIISGPIIVYGVVCSSIVGIIYLIFGL